ncbi:MAG: 3-dehydroquinate synthase [Denitrovibrio sp.]|nr:MAG: 3-dehydroquinate synthase [Denitrovibrio sp.]
MKTVKVDLKKEVDSSYEITIGSSFAREVLQKLRDEGAYFMVDENVFELYQDYFDHNNMFRFRADEHNKTHESVVSVLGFLFKCGARRDANLAIVGGGITGDVGGFAAATYMRGISFVQMPTTLLSMVDSSVGGKTGINFRGAKNNVGAFSQPQHVYIDMHFLNTLTDEEFLNGVAEVIKYGAIFDKEFFDYLSANKDKVIARDLDTLAYVVKRCCEMKADVVKKDEKEKGDRALLNFGHTFAHAIETDSHHGVKHGYAVATGMYLETDFAVKQGEATEETLNAIADILRLYGFDLSYEIEDRDLFIQAMLADKKADKKGLTLALTPAIGSCKILKNIPPQSIEDYFNNI